MKWLLLSKLHICDTIRRVVRYMYAGYTLSKKQHLTIHKHEVADYTEVGLVDWAVIATGKSGNIDLERAWLRHAQSMYQLFCRKNHDYGPNNIAVGGLTGVVVRIGDKTSRLFTLMSLAGTKPLVQEESIKDTLMDLTNYGIAGQMLLDGDWKRVSPKEVWNERRLVSSEKEVEQ